ncbi:IS110 family transposase [Halarcobacter ebronensis]|uniref:IS110 family transposase n=1 Tax=Halarcobacter ebronensis TaxID=1462615 RepID=A0A4Q0YGS0_9BACT|nr:IS110 family transposase [Halarcobacter ebronensis]RXJ68239.1 IS110 family transposase [Halarcobacter ebronensis]
MINCIGLDISKKLIAVHIPINKTNIEIENSLKGIKVLYSKLNKLYKKSINDLVYIFEPTGNYSFTLTKFCNEKNIKCFMINPKQFSNFSKALGQRNKTDLIDAQVLSQAIHLAKEGEIKVPYIDTIVEELKELISYYKFTSKNTSKLISQLESIIVKNGSKYMINDLKKSIKVSKDKELEILSKIKNIINSDDKLLRGYNNIKTITGIGEIGAIVLLHLFIKYPDANQRQIISLAGLNPIEKTSGTSIHKKTKISKAGSKVYRGSLFLGVLTAIRFDDNFRIFFERLKANGKHTTAAQIAVMRKMIIIAHSLYKNNKQYDKEFYKKACGYDKE